MNYKLIVSLVAQELDLSEELVNNTYKAFWLVIKNKILSLPLKEDNIISEEEFDRLDTSINIPSLGKLFCTLQRYKNMKKRFEIIKTLREKC